MPKSFEEIFTENIQPHHDGRKLKCIVHIPPPDSANMLPPGLLLKSTKITSEIFIQCELGQGSMASAVPQVNMSDGTLPCVANGKVLSENEIKALFTDEWLKISADGMALFAKRMTTNYENVSCAFLWNIWPGGSDPMYGHIYKKTQAKCVPLMKAVMDFLCLSSTTPNCQDQANIIGFSDGNIIAFQAFHMGQCRSLQIKGEVPQIDVYQVKMIAYSEKVDNGLTLLRNILPSGRIISIDTSDGKLLKGGKSIAHVDMNNSNNNIENLQMVDLMQALHLLHEFRDEFRDGKESGDFLFC